MSSNSSPTPQDDQYPCKYALQKTNRAHLQLSVSMRKAPLHSYTQQISSWSRQWGINEGSQYVTQHALNQWMTAKMKQNCVNACVVKRWQVCWNRACSGMNRPVWSLSDVLAPPHWVDQTVGSQSVPLSHESSHSSHFIHLFSSIVTFVTTVHVVQRVWWPIGPSTRSFSCS